MATKPLANIVVAITSFSGRANGELVDVRQGDLFHVGDLVVRKWPEFFGPPVVRESQPEPVEQATAAPGEKRGA